ncbi:hypothetical protein FACS1894151_02000 [Spirochaetia bacterium]|nr:hypothetical protein FACS1894151_02000 [Spirochaetia bacterium]
MYSVILTDDEPWALTGLAEVIDWNQYGFKICARCQNAEEALAALEQENADVLFTDLRMPGTDGLELISRVKKEKPEIECVIVSAYSDFDVARKAISYRAAGYVLKPLSRNEVTDIVQRIKGSLDSKDRNILSIDLNNGQSVETALHFLDRTNRYSSHCALLSPSPLQQNEMPQTEGLLEIRIQGAPLRAWLYSSEERKLPEAVMLPAAASMWHNTCRELPAMLREASEAGKGGFNYADHEPIGSIQFYIGTHFDTDISIAAISGLFFLSENYLPELFKKYTDDTLINFTKKVRLYNASRLLEHTDENLKKIAQYTGFNDYSYFGRSFRQLFGITPELFRERYQNSSESFRPDFSLAGG